MLLYSFKFHIQTEILKMPLDAVRYELYRVRVTAVIAATEHPEGTAKTPLVETILCNGCYYLAIYLQGCFFALLIYCYENCLHILLFFSQYYKIVLHCTICLTQVPPGTISSLHCTVLSFRNLKPKFA